MPASAQSTNICSRLSFSWVSPIIAVGRKRALTVSDVSSIDSNHCANSLLSAFLTAWNHELQQQADRVSLVRALHRTISKRTLYIPLLSTIPGYFVMLFTAIFLRHILLFMQSKMDSDSNSDQNDTINVYYYCIGFSLSSLWLAIHGNWLWFACVSNGIDVRVALMAAIIHKSFKLSSSSIESSRIINLLSSDVQRFEEILRILPMTVFPPILIVLTFAYFSYTLNNWYCMLGLLLFAMLIPLQLCFGLRFGKLKDQTVHFTDQRLKIISEVLCNYHWKMYGWELPLIRLVRAARKKEMKYIKRSAVLRCINKAIYASSQCLLIMLIFVPYYYTNHQLDASVIYAVLAVYASLKIPLLWFIPYCVQLFSELSVSIRRIEQFLQATDLHEMDKRIGVSLCDSNSVQKESSPSSETSLSPLSETHSMICIENGNFSWDCIECIQLTQKLTSKKPRHRKRSRHQRIASTSECMAYVGSTTISQFSLFDINLHINANELVAIIGSVGSGKSSLLSAILNEIPCVSGSLRITPRNSVIGYCCQKAWIFSDSVRNNILFGSAFDETWYNTVIDACALRYDIEHLFPHQNETIIGERGANLSGGQKARIGIARAIYCRPHILLFDDSLSALDCSVAQHIFDNVLSNKTGLMKNTIRLFVTHQQQFMHNADSVVVMKDGRIVQHGNFIDVCNQSNVQQILLLDVSSTQVNDQNAGEEQQHYAIRDGLDAVETSLSMSYTEDEHEKKYEYNIAAKWMPDSDKESMNMSSPSALSCIGSSDLDAANESETDTDWTVPQLDLSHVDDEEEESLRFESRAALKRAARRHSIIAEESQRTGNVSLQTYLSIIDSPYKCIKFLKLALTVILMLSAQICLVGSEYWLGIWASQSMQEQHRNSVYPVIYYLLSLCAILLSLWRTLYVFTELLQSCQRCSMQMFCGVLYSPISFFQSNPIGRMLNRFSKDQSLMDEKLALSTYDWIESMATCFTVLILAGLANVYLYIVFIPIALCVVYYARCFLSSSRVLKRLDAKTRSPVFAHFSMMHNGLDIIRAFHKQELMLNEALRKIDVNTSVYLTYHACVHWLGFRLDICMFVVSSVTVFLCVYLVDSNYAQISTAALGVTLSYMLLMAKILPWTVRQFATLENIMVAVERIMEYALLPPEQEEECEITEMKTDGQQKQDELALSTRGRIKMENVCVSYRNGLQDVLHEINLEIKQHEKIAILGRTGCGKSTLFLTLLRMLKVRTGNICIDGIDINHIELSVLRTSICIIPQNPMLLSETLRYNIDPFAEYTDEEIYNVLKQVELFDKVYHKLPHKLLTQISEYGANFSEGETQLICISRVLLNKDGCKILLIDEATANMDASTDAVIQRVLFENFKEQTVLCITHRLHTLMEYDRVVLMEKGRVIQCDSPRVYLQKQTIHV